MPQLKYKVTLRTRQFCPQFTYIGIFVATKLKQNIIVIALTYFMLLLPNAHAMNLPPLDPHFSLEGNVGYRSLSFEDGYGGKVFESSFPQVAFLVGVRFWDYFGVELGYQRTRREGSTARIAGGEKVIGRFIPSNVVSEHHVSEAGLQGQMLNFLLFLPTHPMTRFDIIFGIGIQRSKLLHKDVIVGINDITLDGPINRTFLKKQTHARVMGGIQKLLEINNPGVVKRAGVRILAVWENTSTFKDAPALEVHDAFVTAKNSFVASLGLVVET